MNIDYFVRLAPRLRKAILASGVVPEAALSQSFEKVNLLGTSAKFLKSEAKGMYLPAHLLSAVLCPRATTCQHTCISTTGNLGVFHEANLIRKACFLAAEPERFIEQLRCEITLAEVKGTNVFRLNGSSDLPFEELFAPLFPNSLFLGYTKIPSRAGGKGNRWTAYSWNEGAKAKDLARARLEGFAVAVVLPPDVHEAWTGQGGTDDIVMLDGDEGDHLWIDHEALGKKLVLFCLKQKKRTLKGGKSGSAPFFNSWRSLATNLGLVADSKWEK